MSDPLSPCKQCKVEVPVASETCPECGVDWPGLSKRDGVIMMGILGLLIGGVVWGGVALFGGGGGSSVQADAECRQDLQCWGNQHRADAYVLCIPRVERSARYSYTWTDGFLGSKIDGYAWGNRSRGSVMYYGDNIQYQNGFGAMQTMFYKCTYDPATDSLENFEVLPRG